MHLLYVRGIKAQTMWLQYNTKNMYKNLRKQTKMAWAARAPALTSEQTLNVKFSAKR